MDLDGSGALDVAVAEPVGYVISEKTHPIQQLSSEAAGGHYGISQVVFLAPQINSESAVIALVQYGPGGNTPVHYHPKMEQIEIVLEGRALWEVGEFEREVGPGDVIFTPPLRQARIQGARGQALQVSSVGMEEHRGLTEE